jgi:hypothetical protein
VRVGLDGKWVGATRGTSYLSFAVEPGEHHLCVDLHSEFLEPRRLVSLYGFTAQARKTYYFRARTMASVSSGGKRDIAVLDLDLVNDDQHAEHSAFGFAQPLHRLPALAQQNA